MWELKDMSGLATHPRLNEITDVISRSSFHGILKNIEKLPNGDLQVSDSVGFVELIVMTVDSDDAVIVDAVIVDAVIVECRSVPTRCT